MPGERERETIVTDHRVERAGAVKFLQQLRQLRAKPPAISRLRVGQSLLTVALLAFLLWRTSIGQIGDTLAIADLRLLLIVLALNLPVALLFTFRSRLVLDDLGYHPPLHLLLPASLLGNVAGSLTPAASGELLRISVLRLYAGVSAEDGLALVLYERSMSLLIMIVGTVVVGVFLIVPTIWALAVVLVTLPALATPRLAEAILRLVPAPATSDGRHLFRRLLGYLNRTLSLLHGLLQDRWLQVRWSLATMGIFVVMTLQVWLLAASVSASIHFAEAWVAYSVSQLAGIASLLPFGIGAQDGSIAALLHRFGMSVPRGIAVAVLVRAFVTLPLVLGAVLSYFYLARQLPHGQFEEAVTTAG